MLARTCLTCGVGIDTDGDGNCPFCARMARRREREARRTPEETPSDLGAAYLQRTGRTVEKSWDAGPQLVQKKVS